MEQKMFCYQCQETAGCKGCTISGVCGKTPEVAAMQDLLVYVTKGISAVATALRREGQPVDSAVSRLITLNLFTTITNLYVYLLSRDPHHTGGKRKAAGAGCRSGRSPKAAKWDGSGSWEKKARTAGVLSTQNEDIRSLRELITYGLKGLAAYSKHANVLLKAILTWTHFCSGLWPLRWMTASAQKISSPWLWKQGNMASPVWRFWIKPTPTPMETRKLPE